MNQRPSWNQYFMNITKLVAQRSTCLSRQVGAIAIKDKRILATGYNGQISGAPHCKKCLRKESQSGSNLFACRGIHAEMNILTQAAQHGINLSNATIYVLIKPCNVCFKMLANAKVKQIIYLQDYNDKITDDLIIESGFNYDLILDNDQTYHVIK